MNKIFYCFALLLSITAFSQNYKYNFSNRYLVTVDKKGNYTKGIEENVKGLFYFDMTTAYFELLGEPNKQFKISKLAIDDSKPKIHEMVTIYKFEGPLGKFDIKVYQFVDKRIQIFSSYEGKNYLYIIDKAIAEDGTVYAVKT